MLKNKKAILPLLFTPPVLIMLIIVALAGFAYFNWGKLPLRNLAIIGGEDCFNYLDDDGDGFMDFHDQEDCGAIAMQDADNDGFLNVDELEFGTDPFNPSTPLEGVVYG